MIVFKNSDYHKPIYYSLKVCNISNINKLLYISKTFVISIQIITVIG